MDASPALSRQVHLFGSLLALLMLLSICMPASAQTGIVFSAQYYKWKHGKVKPKQKFAHLYLTRPDGTHPHLLTSGAFDDTNPSWSPDHTRLTFVRRDLSGTSYLCMISMANRHISRLYRQSKNEDIKYTWSPRRNLIGLLSTMSTSSIEDTSCFTILDENKIVMTFKGIIEFAWSDDSQHIYLRYSNNRCEVFSMATHQSRPIPSLINAVWLDGHSILGIIPKGPDIHYSVFDLVSGHKRSYKLIVKGNVDPAALIFAVLPDYVWHRSPTDKNVYVLEVKYETSDGMHTWCFIVHFGRIQGTAQSVDGYFRGVSFGGYSPDGTDFAVFSNEWVGGFKWTGAQQGPLEIRNLSGKRIKFVTSKMVLILGASWY